MKLTDLDAVFLSQYEPNSFHEQPEINGAQGVLFLCPKCQHHMVACWFRDPLNTSQVPDDAEPGPGRWKAIGTGISDLTLHPSINLDVGKSGCTWHGWVINGDAS